VYVSNGLGGGNNGDRPGVQVVDADRLSVVATFDPGGAAPGDVAVSPENRSIYVASPGSGTGAEIDIVDAASRARVGAIALAADPGLSMNPHFMEISPDGKYLYVTIDGFFEGDDPKYVPGDVGFFAVVDLATNTVLNTIGLTGDPTAVVSSPDGQCVYVSTDLGVNVIETASLKVSGLINVAVSGLIHVDGTPQDLAMSPDGQRLYVSTELGVAVIDTESLKVSGVIGVEGVPAGMAISPDGRFLYIGRAANGASEDASGPAGQGDERQHTLRVIDTGAGKEVAAVSVGDSRAVAVSPDGSRVYVASPGLVSVVAVSAS